MLIVLEFTLPLTFCSYMLQIIHLWSPLISPCINLWIKSPDYDVVIEYSCGFLKNFESNPSYDIFIDFSLKWELIFWNVKFTETVHASTRRIYLFPRQRQRKEIINMTVLYFFCINLWVIEHKPFNLIVSN